MISFDPTAREDDKAFELRHWYELNRESWWVRFRRNTDRADDFMLRLLAKARDIEEQK